METCKACCLCCTGQIDGPRWSDQQHQDPKTHESSSSPKANPTSDSHRSDWCSLGSSGCVNTKIWYRRESDLWAQLGKNPVQRRKVSSKRFGRDARGRQFCFCSARELFALISRDRMVTWPERKGRMDG
jgi:hypothetical protein